MDSVMQWATSVCICSAVVCIIEMLISDTALEKTVRFVLGAFMLCAVIVPLGSIAKNLSADFHSTDMIVTNIPENISDQRVTFLKQEIEELVRKTLEEEEIYPIEIHINMDIDESGCISIITADVTLDRSDIQKSAEVREVLTEKLGIECKTMISE